MQVQVQVQVQLQSLSPLRVVFAWCRRRLYDQIELCKVSVCVLLLLLLLLLLL